MLLNIRTSIIDKDATNSLPNCWYSTLSGLRKVSNISISVIMLTYKHESYIQQAIEGVLKQQTSYSWELIIADDNSPDGTQFICERFAKTDVRIRYIRNASNLGANKNFFNAYSLAKGKYIALCEGDDYWSDPLKLEKQVGFLEQNPDYAICFHNVQILKDSTLHENEIKLSKVHFDILELAKGNFMHTPSVVSRKLDMAQIPGVFGDIHVGDFMLHMLTAREGNIRYLPDVMAV